MRPEEKKRIELGKVIKQKREEKGVSQRYLCRKAKCSHTTLCNIEKGNCNPQYDVLLKLANALEVPIEELISDKQRIQIAESEVMEIPQDMQPEVSYVNISGKMYFTMPASQDIISQMERIIAYNEYVQKYVKKKGKERHNE